MIEIKPPMYLELMFCAWKLTDFGGIFFELQSCQLAKTVPTTNQRMQLRLMHTVPWGVWKIFYVSLHNENLTKGQWKKPQKLQVCIEKCLLWF